MSTVKIHVLHTGEIGVSPALLTGGGDRFAAEAASLLTPERRRVWLPVSVYLIEHPRGLVLFDTGLPENVAGADIRGTRKALGDALYNVMHAKAERSELADVRLAELGVRPKDIDYVFLSHLDADNAGGVSLFRQAGQILLAEEERFWASRTNFRFVKSQWNYEPLETYWFRGNGIGPNGRSYKVFGDDSLELVNVPGHTFGSVAAVIRSNGRYAVLCGDTAVDPGSWQKALVPGMAENDIQQKKALLWLRDMASSPDCAACLSSHDPSVEESVIEL